MIQLVFDAATPARGAAALAGRDRLQPARGRRARGVGRRQARARRRHASGRASRPPGRTRTSSARRSTSAARPSRASAATTRAGRRSTSARSCGRSRATRRGRARRSRGSGSRAAGASCSPAFFNGPTGPNLKTQWTRADHAGRRAGATAQLHGPGGSAFGGRRRPASSAAPSAAGSQRARPARATGRSSSACVLAVLVLLVIVALRPGDLAAGGAAPPRAPARLGPDPLARRARMYVGALPLFLGIGRPVACRSRSLVTLLQALVLHATSVLGVQTGGERSGVVVVLRPRDRDGADAARARPRAGGDARARSSRSTRAGRSGRSRAYRLALDAIRPLFGALLIAVVVVSLLASSLFLIPIAVWLAGRWALIAPAIELEERSGARRAPPQRPARAQALAEGRVARSSPAAALVLVAGPLVGVVLILVPTRRSGS